MLESPLCSFIGPLSLEDYRDEKIRCILLNQRSQETTHSLVVRVLAHKSQGRLFKTRRDLPFFPIFELVLYGLKGPGPLSDKGHFPL